MIENTKLHTLSRWNSAMKYLPKFRFSVRTLMIITAMLGVGFGYLGLRMRRAQKQREVVAWVQEHRGSVEYSFRRGRKLFHIGEIFGSYVPFVDFGKSPVPEWLLNLFGVDFFHSVTVVDFPLNDDIADLAPLASLTDLKKIWIPFSNVTDLSSIAHLTQIEELSLSGSSVTDLSPLENFKHLKELVLNATEVESLEPLFKLKRLSRVYLWGTKVSKEEVSRLQKALPDCEIGGYKDYP
ncbi:MAG: hypothetical protein COA78_08770 [Blastopirellula sp.]|nr:MAG: hypothetical protein COA78_08770 [Blastopirellula sp.]